MTTSTTRGLTSRARRRLAAGLAPRLSPAPRRRLAAAAALITAGLAASLAPALGVAGPAAPGLAAVSSATAGSLVVGSAALAPVAVGPAGPHPIAMGGVTVPTLSLAQMAGQRVIYSYSGLTPPAKLFRWISAGKAAGVIFFGGNISSKTQIAGVIAKMERANASAGNPLRAYPLLLMTDQEGGQVRRLPGAPLLSEKQIGQSAHPAEQAKAAGTGAGQNLASAGMNVNLAPVLDVYRAPGGFDDQFGRSYSMNPLKVSYLGADFIKSQQPVGVAATAKHFPGLGAATATQNTDVRPVTLNVSKHDLRTIDEFPYQAAIGRGVKLVMVSWAVYPALDPNRPAGLSRAIIGGELRQRLGFTGVTITDAMEAGALTAYGTIPNRGLLAARAGMDLLLCSAQSSDEGKRVRVALENSYTAGTLSRAAFGAAVQRVIALRASLARG
jgi:beta-N-acetylhexosaminidase